MSKRSKKKNIKKGQNLQQTESKSLKIPVWDKNPNWIAMGLLFVLLLVFFYPVMLSDKTFLTPDRLASKSFGSFVKESLNKGTYPLWNPYIFGGMPSFASLSSAPYVDLAGTVISGGIWLVRRIIPLPDFTLIFINYLLFGGMIFLLLRSNKISPEAAFFSGVAMVFMPQVMAYAAFGHNTKLACALFIPLIFLCAEQLLKKKNLLFFSLFGLAVGLQLLRKHIQIIYYTQLMVVIYFIYWSVNTFRKEKKIKEVLNGGVLLLGALLLGLCLSSVINLSVYEYSHYSMRGGGGGTGGLGYDYATNWSFPPSEITTYFIPSFIGFGRDTYWGAMPFTDFPLYFGIIVFLLAGLAMVINRNKATWFFAILAGFALLVSFGRHLPVLFGPMFKFLPFFNKFRAPKMIQILLQFSMVVLAGFGLQGVLDFKDPKGDKMRQVKRYLLGFGGVTVFLFLILLLGKGAYMRWASKAAAGAWAAYDKASNDGLRALVFFGFSAVFVLMALRRKLHPRILPFLLAGLLIIDFWTVDRKFVEPKPQVNAEQYFAETPEVTYLKQQGGYFRILPVGEQRTPNWYMYHKIQSAYGYQGAKLRIYQELMDAFGMPNGYLQKYLKVENGRYVWKRPGEISGPELHAHHNFLKLMNVEYVLCPYPLPDTTLQLVFPPRTRGGNGVYKVKDALPRVFFPKEVITVKDKKTILNVMSGPGFDPSHTAIIEERLPGESIFSENNKAEITGYDIHQIDIEAEIETHCLMALSEIYYPAGWKAFVDGQEVPIMKTDYVLRSVSLSPGSHRIEFKFRPKMFRIGLVISLVTFFILISGIWIGWRMEKKKRKEEVQES